MENIKKYLKALVILVVLQFLIDMLYVYLYPTVNPIRATLIGATAFVLLWIPILRKHVGLAPYVAFLPIFVNAMLGALSVQAKLAPSKSFLSGLLHVGILIVTYVVIVFIKEKKMSKEEGIVEERAGEK